MGSSIRDLPTQTDLRQVLGSLQAKQFFISISPSKSKARVILSNLATHTDILVAYCTAKLSLEANAVPNCEDFAARFVEAISLSGEWRIINQLGSKETRVNFV
jgi:hypothetical protein